MNKTWSAQADLESKVIFLVAPDACYWEIILAQVGNKVNQIAKNRCGASEWNEGEQNKEEWIGWSRMN